MKSTSEPADSWSSRRVVVVVQLTNDKAPVIRHNLKDVVDIMCEPRNVKLYGVHWAFCVATSDKDAREQWEAHKVSGNKLPFCEVLPPR